VSHDTWIVFGFYCGCLAATVAGFLFMIGVEHRRYDRRIRDLEKITAELLAERDALDRRLRPIEAWRRRLHEASEDYFRRHPERHP
jgi:hypothetical protein